MIHQKVNYVLDCLYFRRYSQIVRAFLKPVNTPKTNAQMMSKADNNNNYDFDQASGEKQTG